MFPNWMGCFRTTELCHGTLHREQTCHTPGCFCRYRFVSDAAAGAADRLPGKKERGIEEGEREGKMEVRVSVRHRTSARDPALLFRTLLINQSRPRTTLALRGRHGSGAMTRRVISLL